MNEFPIIIFIYLGNLKESLWRFGIIYKTFEFIYFLFSYELRQNLLIMTERLFLKLLSYYFVYSKRVISNYYISKKFNFHNIQSETIHIFFAKIKMSQS